jgi:serine phosphatase RsbU (regulator of sigma subunit)
MPDGPPPRPTSRVPAGKAPAKPTASSTQIPRAGSTRRVAPAPPSGPVVVASHDGDEPTHVRQRMAGTRGPRGLSLRWKIVIAMVGITVATAVLIFVVVYTKAMGQLEDEIDAKGARMVNLLASVDADFWTTAIHTQENSREADFQEFITGLSGPQNVRQFVQTRGLNPAYRRLVEPFGEAREEEIVDLVTKILGDERWKRSLESDGVMRRRYERLARPLGSLAALSPLRGLAQDRNAGLLDAGVVDVSGGERNAPAITIKGHVEVTLPSSESRQGVTQRDVPRQEGNQQIMSRVFMRDQAPDANRKLRYYVALSLARIDEAKGSLRTAIFLPIFVSVLLGTGIAIWMSTLITEPLKVLMHDMQEVSAGNLEHQTVARSKDEVGLLATTFNRMTQALNAAHEQEIEAKALEHDLSIASEIQSNLVPKRMLKIPGWDVSAYYRPSKEVGGDYYDFIEIDDDREGIIVADVSGKGIPGSLVMTMARAFIRMKAERSGNPSPAETLVHVNRMLAQDIKKGMFVTALYCILDKRTGEIRVASAGHNPLVVWRAAANAIELVNPNGIALGFDKGPVFERTVKEEKLVLNHGDRIVAYTDGVVEAMDAKNQEFGDKRFHQLVQQLALRDSNQMLNLLVKTLDEHKGDAPQSDDITIVTLRYL